MRTVIDEILEFQAEGFHRSLGYGKSGSPASELENFELSRPAYHRSLGLGIVKAPQAFQSELQGELVGNDDRKRIGSTRKVPFRWITCLDLIYPDPDVPGGTITFRGSGVLVSNRHILTAGHCLYDNITGSLNIKSAKLQPIGVTAYFGRSGTYYFTSSKASTWKIHPNWLSSLSAKFDLGLIKLQTLIGEKNFSALEGEKLGYWGSPTDGHGSRMIPFDKANILNKKANLAGYPGDKPEWLMWSMDKIVNTNPQAGSELIYYLGDTCGGQSGCPVWLTNESTGGRFLIAIHTGPCIAGSGITDCAAAAGTPCFPHTQRYTSNRGVFLSKPVIDMVYQWIRTI